MFTNLKKVFGGFFVFSVFIGCVSQPLTKSVINDIGIEDINRFQYYISDNIILTATERIREPSIDNKGTAKIRDSSFRDIIIISKNTMGVLMDSKIDETGLLVLEICFEEKAADIDKRITFKQAGPGLQHNFYVTYTDPQKKLMQYGDKEFALETKTGERVYLKIKIDKKEIEQERIRRVKGRKVEN